MADLIVIGFNTPEKADEVLLRLTKLKKEYLIDLEDAVVVVRDEKGEVHLKQSIHLAAIGASTGLLSGGLWGALVGLLFFNPAIGFVVGGAIGAGAGALSGSLTDYGINDDFIRSVGQTIPPNSSALFILVRKVQPEKVLAELSDVKGKVLRTSLSPDQEKKLQEALSSSTAVAGT
jgi:uncharacterized membrane protein